MEGVEKLSYNASLQLGKELYKEPTTIDIGDGITIGGGLRLWQDPVPLKARMSLFPLPKVKQAELLS